MTKAPARFLVTASSAAFLLTGPVAGGAAERSTHHDQAYLLWPDGAPKANGNQDIDQPWLTVHLPEPGQGNGAAVIVNPGGGYRILASDHEGLQVARWLNRHGVAAFVRATGWAPSTPRTWRYSTPTGPCGTSDGAPRTSG